MRKISAICANVIRILIRNGTVPGIMISLGALSVFIFVFARSDGEIINELRIRIRYSFFFFYTLISVVVMYLSCITLRKDIENRQFHNVASAPVHRYQIWLGKFFGILIFGMACFFFSSLVTALCAAVYIGSHCNEKDMAVVNGKFLRAYLEKVPLLEPIERQIEDRFKKMQAEGNLSPGLSDKEIKRQLWDEIRKDEQMLKPNGEKSWSFTWDSSAASRFSDHIILKVKFYAEQKREMINGRFTLTSPDSSAKWEQDFSGFSYMYHEIRIPISKIPSSGQLRLSFKGTGNPYIIFPVANGIALLYDNGGIISNYIRMSLIIFVNMIVLTAIGLTSAALFTYTVSVFVTLVVYLVGMSADFFLSVIRELSYGWQVADGSSVYLLTGFIKFGLWLTKGIKCPPVIETFTENISIPLGHISMVWGMETLFYAAAVMALGILILTRKEIDKLMSS